METGSIEINQGLIYYERSGSGIPVIFIHGAFADMHMFDPQWDFFIEKIPILRFDLRGHGNSGLSGVETYQMDTFIDDLVALMDVLEIPEAIICGQSWGGSIAQGFAAQHPERVKGLVVAGSMVSMSVSFGEKLQRYVLVPRWLMLFIIRTLSVEHFVNFSFWLSDIFFGKEFLSNDKQTTNYLKKCMLSIDSKEYLKVWGAIYHFDMFPLERIACPTLVLNGEYESGKILRHTRELLKRIPDVRFKIIPEAKHGMNMENPNLFNQTLVEFIQECNQHQN